MTRAAAAVVLTTCAVACAGAPQKPELMARLAKEQFSVAQLRAIDYEFASRFGQLVARCAQDVLHVTENADHRRYALVWRVYAPAEARTAAFTQDPLAGLLELWALTGQQREYFLKGDGSSFGRAYPCVAETSIELETEARAIGYEVLGDQEGEKMVARLAEWVADNPIEGEFYVRPTAQARLAAFVGSNAQGGLKAVGSMEETLRDLNDRVGILSVQLPREARWQAEYLVDALFEEHLAEPSDTLVSSLNRIVDFLQEFEGTLGVQTTRLLEGFTLERQAVFDSLDVETAKLFESFEVERLAIFDSVDEEVDEVLERFEETGQGLIDYFFDRLIRILIAIGFFVFAMTALLVWALRPRASAPPKQESPTPPEGRQGED